MIYQLVAAITLAASVSATLYSKDVTVQKYMWEAFKMEYNRKYSTAEVEAQKFANFLENLKLADTRNENERKAGGTAIHGITKFSDLSQAEFSKFYLGSDPNMKGPKTNVMSDLPPPKANAALVDWTGIYTTAVKDQVSFFFFI